MQTIGAQSYCCLCAGPLQHTSYLHNYPNFYSIFNSPDQDLGELLHAGEINFSSIKYKLVSIIYTSHDWKKIRPSDHFLSMVRKDHNGTTSFFICDVLSDYRKPVLLSDINEFPVTYDEIYRPMLLVFQKIVMDTAISVKISDAITITNLDEDYEYALEIEMIDKLPPQFEYECHKTELANYFISYIQLLIHLLF